MSSTFGIKKLSDIKNLKRPELTIIELMPNEIKCFGQVRSEKNVGFNGPSLQELSDSMKTEGQHEPVIVRLNPDKTGPKYVMVAGERRLRAADMARIKIKAIVHDVSETEARRIQLSENIHRENLSQLEIAQAVKDDLERLGKMDKVSKAWNKSQQWVSQQIKFFEISQGSGPASDAIKENLTSDRTAINTLGKLQEVNLEKAIEVIEQLKTDQKEGKRPNVRKAAEEALREEKSLQAPCISIAADKPNALKVCKNINQFVQEMKFSHHAIKLYLICSGKRLEKLSCTVCNAEGNEFPREIAFEPDVDFSIDKALSFLLLHIPQAKCDKDFKCEILGTKK